MEIERNVLTALLLIVGIVLVVVGVAIVREVRATRRQVSRALLLVAGVLLVVSLTWPTRARKVENP